MKKVIICLLTMSSFTAFAEMNCIPKRDFSFDSECGGWGRNPCHPIYNITRAMKDHMENLGFVIKRKCDSEYRLRQITNFCPLRETVFLLKNGKEIGRSETFIKGEDDWDTSRAFEKAVLSLRVFEDL